ncbi:RPM1-interacting protein 4-like [Cicer arietinum]|uniref:Protein NOI4-like n=1 Tax=Cicer arietinum TaxID=3827 RepID=A0A1S2YBE7_CICAR|nr:protein NOI4-like [Cicer arietinum]
MASYSEEDGKPLPKFGEWDVNDPSSAEGFTVIFNKARDDKKVASASGRFPSQRRNDSRARKDNNNNNNKKYNKTSSSTKKKWFCFTV